PRPTLFPYTTLFRSKPLQFLGLTHGPFTGATVEALHAAERMPKVAAADYDMRLLKIPAVYLAALWLHADNDDILIPMGNPPAGRSEEHTSELQSLGH